ncbi:MAG: hypothetical protein IKZ96_01175 [Bacilli bacterium]|nr:hypothetical protein [Bacilli bacterium]
MEFSDFMSVLYTFTDKRYENKEIFFKDIISNSVILNKDSFIQSVDASTVNRYMNGKLSFAKNARKVLSNMDKENLARCFDLIFDEDDKLISFKNALIEKGAVIDNDFEDSYDVVEYFYTLLELIALNKKERLSSQAKMRRISFDSLPINSTYEEFMNVLNCNNDELSKGDDRLNDLLPPYLKDDFEYKIDRLNSIICPNLYAKNINAYINHKQSFKYRFKNKKDADKFVRSIYKANMLNKWIEVYPDSVESYIDDYNDKFFNYMKHRYFIGPSKNKKQELLMNLSIDNKHFLLCFDNLLLKEKSINGDILEYNNIDDDNWLFIRLLFNCKDSENGRVEFKMSLGIKKKEESNVDILKELYKLNLLMQDNSTHITLINTPNKGVFMDKKLDGRLNIDENEYIKINNSLNIMNKISEIQRITNKTFKFDPEEFDLKLPTYEIAYALVKGKPTVIKRDVNVDILVPNELIKDYSIGSKKDRIDEVDNITIFDQNITFEKQQVILKNAETINVYIENGLYHAVVFSRFIEIKKL